MLAGIEVVARGYAAIAWSRTAITPSAKETGRFRPNTHRGREYRLVADGDYLVDDVTTNTRCAIN